MNAGDSPATTELLKGMTLATELSAGFINATGDLRARIENALEELCRFTDTSRAGLFLFSLETGIVSNSHEWCKNPADSRQHRLQQVPLDDFPFMASLLFRGKDAILGRPEDLPQSSAEQEYMERYGFRPAFCVPLQYEQNLLGMLALYGDLNQSRQWAPWLSPVLRLAGNSMVSALKRQEQNAALALERAHLRSLFDSAPVPALIWRATDDDFVLTAFNTAAASLTEGRIPEFLGRTARDIYPDRPDMIEHFTRCRREKQTLTLETHYQPRSVASPGEIVIFTFAYVSDAVLVLHAKSVTQRRQTEQAARERERIIESILENSPAVIYMKDLSGRYLRINRQYERIFGTRREDVLGKTDKDIFPPDVVIKIRANDLAVLESGKPAQFEEIVPQLDGLHTYLSVKFPIPDDSGQVYALCGISTDITDRSLAEEELRRAHEETANANAAQSRFLATVSHEMRTPLHAIVGLSDLLVSEINAPEPHRKLRILNHSAQNLLHLINDILDFEKIRANRLLIQERSLEIRPMIAGYELTFPILASSSNVSFSTATDERLPELLQMDAVRIGQILTNLVSNAAKYTAEGSVTLKADLLSKSDDVYNVEFSVTDTGRGIAPELLPLLGQPFTQLSAPGVTQGSSGLGLAIVMGILDLYGSSLKVETEPGRGSRFSFVLSLRKGTPPRPVPPEVIESRPLHILLADDNEVNVRVLGAYLDKWGFTYDACENGQEAVDIFSPGRHDAVIMDILMPGMNGIDAAAEILRRSPEARIIALTADLSPDNMARMRLPGGAKPG